MATTTIITVTTTAVQLLAASGDRKAYTVINRGTDTIYIGSDDTVAAATGATLQAGDQVSGEDDPAAVWAVAAAGSQRVEVLEVP